MDLTLTINRTAINKDVHNWATFNDSFMLVTLKPKEIMSVVLNGYSFSSIFDKCDYNQMCHRDGDSFVGQQVFAIDVDDPVKSMEEAVEVPFISEHAMFAYETPSSSDALQKYRVVFGSPVVIKDKDDVRAFYKGLSEMCQLNDDKSCHEPARFFFGSKNANSRYIGNTLDEEVTDGLIRLGKLRIAEEAPIQVVSYAGTSTSVATMDSYFMNAVEQEADDLARLGQGSRHNELLNASIKLASISMACGGSHNARCDFIRSKLFNASVSNMLVKEDGQYAVQKAIEDGIRYATPRNIDWRPVEQKKIAVPKMTVVTSTLTSDLVEPSGKIPDFLVMSMFDVSYELAAEINTRLDIVDSRIGSVLNAKWGERVQGHYLIAPRKYSKSPIIGAVETLETDDVYVFRRPEDAVLASSLGFPSVYGTGVLGLNSIIVNPTVEYSTGRYCYIPLSKQGGSLASDVNEGHVTPELAIQFLSQVR